MLCFKMTKFLLLAICLTLASSSGSALPERNAKRKVSKRKKVRKPVGVDYRFKQLRGDYNARRLTGASAWAKFYAIEKRSKELNKAERASLYQIQADILMRSGYPILASVYAADAIKTHPIATHRDLGKAWSTLKVITRQKPLQMLTEELAEELVVDSKVPYFDRDWHYFEGNNLATKGKPRKALRLYSKLRMDDRYYLPAKYQKAMIYAEDDKLKKAIVELRSILTAIAEIKPNLDQIEKQRLFDMTNLALGRLYYQTQDFKRAIFHFRQVTRGGESFYDSLFEQSWAFFMAGYPSHALGTLHGTNSPFYEEVFNPEASMLRAIVFYWMCRYEDSRNALADFMENHSKTVESLGVFLSRQRLSEQTAYQLFEDFVSGVSADSLGIPRDILKSAAESDSMMLLRDQYAHAYYELDRLEGVGVSRNKGGNKFAKKRLQAYIKKLKKDIGGTYITELKAMKQTFDRLYDQAQFLYIELLMSEKEQALGRELHSDAKLTASTANRKIRGWASKAVAWDVDEKNEYWWDEVGYHIYDVSPQCSHQ